MSIVPREVVAELWRKNYGKGSEQPYGQAQLFADDLAEWALEQAAKAALKEAQDRFIYETYTQTMADAMVKAIRALVSPSGNLKRGESDGQ